MSAEPDIDIDIDDDGRIHIEPGATGGLTKIWIAGQPVGKMLQRLNQRVGELENEVEEERQRTRELEAKLDGYADVIGDLHQQSSGTEYGSKKNLAEHLAHDEAVRVSTQGISGGAIEYTTIQDIAHRQHDRELNSGTVYDAFDTLAEEHDYFHVKEGGRGPNTANKQLVCEHGEVPDPVFASVTGGES